MTTLARRRLLFGGAALAATASLFVLPTSAQAAANKSAERDGPVVVRWNSHTNRWAGRPKGAEFGVVFLSTNDPAATAPKDPAQLAGDVWRRHPEAVAA